MKVKKINKISMVVLAVLFVFSFTLPSSVLAATTPSLGAAGTFGILSSTFTHALGATSIVGDLGYTTISGAGTYTVSSGTDYGSGAPYSTAGTDEATALSALNVQACTFTFATGPINLSTDTTHGPAGVYTPGVYCTGSSSAASIGTAGIILNGTGTYIFRINGAFTSVDNSNVTLVGGATSCDVFWTPTAATTLGANTTFIGTIIDDSGITIGNTTAITGRALAFGGTVTTDTDTITSTCSAPATSPSSSPQGGGGGQLFPAPLISVLKVPTPLALPSGPGSVTYNYTVSNPGTIPLTAVTLVDNKCPIINFVSGDINNNAQLDTNETWHYSCTAPLSQTTTNSVTATGKGDGMTATDVASATVIVGTPGLPNTGIVPPLIHIVKVPNLFTVPYNGAVTYTYTVTNPGAVPLMNVTVADDKCGPVVMRSGDINNNNMLDTSEAWIYTCQTNLIATTTNTAVAQGTSNNLNAVDDAIATVVVSVPGLPKTGYPPEENSTPLNIIILASILTLATASVVVFLKRRT
ncbi:MAG: ice-binding family protein [Candidatus Pacebacteria bacterium]|nr:ice-binding family protein [Candidatus Paceibacterota bacterium]